MSACRQPGKAQGKANRPQSRYRSGQMPRPSKARKPARKPQGGPHTFGRLQRALDEAARREIEAALKETSGNVSESARVLGIARPNLWAGMKALAIVPRR